MNRLLKALYKQQGRDQAQTIVLADGSTALGEARRQSTAPTPSD